MATRREILEARLRATEEALAKVLCRPAEPTADSGEKPVIRFDARFSGRSGSSITYSYVAIGIGGHWYTSSGEHFLSWDSLIDWLEDKLVGDIWLVESYVKLDG
jgi:hypothetical protein